jgi:hypothetical protein
MEPMTKKILVVVLVTVVIVLGLTLGLVLGLRKKAKDDGDEVVIVNSYDNTEELIQKFPVNNPTTVMPGIEEKIQNRLLTGFENWNRGFLAWKKWGSILYTEASIYNVHGARLTLSQYQDSMDVTLKRTNILMGDFHNMLICGDFAAIYYDIITVVGGSNRPGTVMEFVKFKDYGEQLGTRVVVGWGGTKDDSVNSMRYFQGDEESMIQNEQNLLLMNYQIPTSGTLEEKYPVLYPVEYTDQETAEKYIDIILEGFDKWNTGINDYKTWVGTGYTADAISYDLRGNERTMNEYKTEMQTLSTQKEIKKLYFDNILIRDNWAALHYRYRSIDSSNEIYVGDRMQFLKFRQDGSGFKIERSWIK